MNEINIFAPHGNNPQVAQVHELTSDPMEGAILSRVRLLHTDEGTKPPKLWSATFIKRERQHPAHLSHMSNNDPKQNNVKLMISSVEGMLLLKILVGMHPKKRCSISQIEPRQQYFSTLLASATLYPTRILIDTSDITKEGIGIQTTAITLLPPDADNETLGAAIHAHLKASKSGVSRPNYSQTFKDFLRAAGFKTMRQYHKDALHLSISQKEGNIILTPTHNGGSSGPDRGFSDIPGAAIILPSNIDNLTLGHATRQAWKSCE